jgi:hypothetical protein
MEIDVNTWTSIASLIVSILALFPRNKSQRDENQQRALLAVSAAYHETAAYLEARAAKGRDRDREWRIVQKWREAAWMLGRYDSDLSWRLSVKSRFWEEGGTWDPQAIKDAGIGLTTIWREVKALLGTQADPPEDDVEPSEVVLMRFLCPNCGKRCKAPVGAVGRKGSCPRCGISLEVPPLPGSSVAREDD